MKKVRKAIVIVATTIEITLFVTEIAAPGQAEHLRRAALLDLLPDLLDDVVLRLEEAEPAAPLGQVVDVVGSAWTKSFTWLTSVGTKAKPIAGDRERARARR